MGDRQNDSLGEDALIARYFRPLAMDPGAFNLLDDADLAARCWAAIRFPPRGR
jgi:hypothetical protein